MGRLAALAAVLAAGFLVFYAGARTPDPAPVNTAPDAFSAGRAIQDIAVMAQAPHPVGSPQNAKVRDYLLQRMATLGLSPRIQRKWSQGFEPRGATVFGNGAEVENVIGVLPGKDPSLPAVVLMAHYDSVPGSPGAADDLAGVASALEIVRAIKAQGPPLRSVMLVMTDGEEAGLLGAGAFFSHDPLARQAGFVLNMEARGGGGRAAMFETGEANGAAIDIYRRSAPQPLANSLSMFVYKLLPNDTDFTVAKAHGASGLNFAFIGREFDYHSPSSTLAALDAGSVQHLGAQVLGMAKALAFASRLPPRAPDAAYGTVPGGWLVAYPPALGWGLLAAIAALLGLAAWRARRTEPLSWLDGLQGAGATLLVMAASGLVLHLVRRATGIEPGWYEGRALLARFPAFEVAMALGGAGAVMLVVWGLGHGRARLPAAGLALAAGLAASLFNGFDLVGLVEGALTAILALILLGRPARLAGVWLGLLSAALVLAAALQLAAPTIGLIIAWPLAAAAVSAALLDLGCRRAAAAWLAAAVIGALAVGWTGDLFHTLLQGLDLPEPPLAPLWLASLALWPLLWPKAEAHPAPGLVLASAGVALAIGLDFTSPWSPRHPRAAEPLYVLDLGAGQAWRASPFAPDPWAKAVLTADGGRIERRMIPGFARPVWAAPAAPAAAPAPPISIEHSADGRIMLHAAVNLAGQLDLALKADGAVREVLVNGEPAPILARAGQTARLRWRAAPEGVTVSFKPSGRGALHIDYADWTPGWPTRAKPVPPMPADVMGWDMAGSTVAVGRLTERW